MTIRHPWQLLASAMPCVQAATLVDGFKQTKVVKSELAPCSVCMAPAPHPMRIQHLHCACKACADITSAQECPWRARVMSCQEQGLVTVEEAYIHATPARSPRKLALTPSMKEVVKDWAAQGLKPKRIYNALLQRFNLTEATAPSLPTVQRFAHIHVTGRLGGSDLLDSVCSKIKDSGSTGQEDEAAPFTFTSRSNTDGKPIAVNGSDADPFVVDVSSKKLLRRADRDPESFIFHLDATYKLTQVGYPVIHVGIFDRARRFHLLAIFIVSQQQQQQQHYTEVLALVWKMYLTVIGKSLRERYVMGDADAVQWNAVSEVFGQGGEFVFLMCYFHVAKKVYEKTRSLGPVAASSVIKDIHELHFATDEAAYNVKLGEAQARWSKAPELVKFSSYFAKVCLNEKVWRWQCFHTPSGFASTNNPCETYNAAIKRDVTLRRKLKVGALLPQLLTLCQSEAVTARPFAVSPEPDSRLVRRTRATSRSGLLELHFQSRNSIAFLLATTTEEGPMDTVRVASKSCPRVLDEICRRNVEDLPITTRLSKLTAAMETLGMPSKGWLIDMKTGKCPCPFSVKQGSCVHTLYAMECRGTVDLNGRQPLMNRGPSARKNGKRFRGRPRKNGAALEKE